MTNSEEHIVKGKGNVTQATSTCPWLNSQSLTETFTYDASDQLVSATETNSSSYSLSVNYGNWGKIMQYDLTQTDMLNNATSQISRSLTYPSHANNVGNSQTPFAPTMQNGDEDVFFTFGINGSLRKREVQTPNPHTEYYLFNSQGNLKAYSDDVMSFAYYGYNAANTRTYKISLYNTNLWINGQQQPLHLQWQNAMFYPNTYLNFDAFGNYTKHYYNGMERVASRLGDNNTTIAIDNMLENRKLLLEEQVRNEIQELISETPQVDLPPVLDILNLQPTGTPNDIYYYHPNHLGSTSFVTDQNQTITQGFLYAPYGEITTEYNVNFGNNTIPKYAFNAKELDEETGMYYYEARYYAPPTFISRDPLMSEKPWLTPYHYCSNNPIGRVDPNGMMDTDFGVMPNGKVKQIGQSNNNPDRLYALDAEGNKKENVKPITVTNKTLLPSLAGKTNLEEKEYPYHITIKTIYDKKTKKTYRTEIYSMIKGNYGITRCEWEAKRVFKFLGGNSDVEWCLTGFRNGNWVIGTLYSKSQAPTYTGLGDDYSQNKRVYDAHSHGKSYGGPSPEDLRNYNPKYGRWLLEPNNPDPSKRWIRY